MRAPDSPCIGVCVLDVEGRCQGCLRTTDEIAAWGGMDAEAQWQLIERLIERAERRDVG